MGKNRHTSKTTNCVLLNGPTSSTDEKYMDRCSNTCDIFLGIEHRMRKETMEDIFNKDAGQGWRYAADAKRITDEKGRQ